MSNLTGQTLLKRYRIDEFLGRGGMAEVYRTWDAQRSVYVAIKVLNEDLAEDNVFLRRFAREAQVLELLQHPHIVRFFGFEESHGLAFLVMEYIDGVTLRRQLKLLGRPLTLPEALAVLQPVCSALHYAHGMGIYHCDVKPANIFIERGGRVVLGDFGIARLSESATVTFSTPGTPAYMTPEQCRGEELDARTDIYSLGVTIYEMLTLDRPFKGDTEGTTGSRGERVRWEQLNVPPLRPRSVNPDISPAAEAAILRALEKEPEQRQQGALEFYKELSKRGRVQPAATLPWIVEGEPLAAPSVAAAEPVAVPPAAEEREKWHRLLVEVLRERWGERIATLFERVWRSEILANWPALRKWLVAFQARSLQRKEEIAMDQVDARERLVRASVEKAEALITMGQMEQALKELEDAYHMAPELVAEGYARALVQQATQEEEAGDVEGALASYRRALQVAPEESALWQEVAAVTYRLEAKLLETEPTGRLAARLEVPASRIVVWLVIMLAGWVGALGFCSLKLGGLRLPAVGWAVAGALVGLAQWLVVKRVAGVKPWWIIVAPIGWCGSWALGACMAQMMPLIWLAGIEKTTDWNLYISIWWTNALQWAFLLNAVFNGAAAVVQLRSHPAES